MFGLAIRRSHGGGGRRQQRGERDRRRAALPAMVNPRLIRTIEASRSHALANSFATQACRRDMGGDTHKVTGFSHFSINRTTNNLHFSSMFASKANRIDLCRRIASPASERRPAPAAAGQACREN
jgi:hypothetical protein